MKNVFRDLPGALSPASAVAGAHKIYRIMIIDFLSPYPDNLLPARRMANAITAIDKPSRFFSILCFQ
ncbi:TPA: hypothetical protein QHO33_000769 [Citrobacter freundii]|uniref:Uncharacterized protein n=1 Tax=Citrobacter freundii TaxID=546 RepID=A0AAP9TWQ3_CITFR|nr:MULTISPECIES: hypothetical protein [Citrobacter]EKV4112710.1 hypothetical protein [Citrobacter freundii]EKV4144347.1 hypothetical protein [Citrobacter freundii]ELK6655451.1 hypothetical protein [Citrobacter freundii]ELM2196227.1 hypothetical protein [Citrobacter freundii]ELO3996583.1 hypothetical protein [Citrobacter freundii]